MGAEMVTGIKNSVFPPDGQGEGLQRRRRAPRRMGGALLLQVLLLLLGVLSGCYSPYATGGGYDRPYPYYGYPPYGYSHYSFGHFGHGGYYGHPGHYGH